MCTRFLHQIFVTILSSIVLLSTISFPVEKHFCGDVLIDITVFGEVERCTLEHLETEQEQITKVPCCKDTLEVVSTNNQLNISFCDNWNVNQIKNIGSVVYSYKSLCTIIESKLYFQNHYRPPNLVTDLQLWDQVFII